MYISPCFRPRYICPGVILGWHQKLPGPPVIRNRPRFTLSRFWIQTRGTLNAVRDDPSAVHLGSFDWNLLGMGKES